MKPMQKRLNEKSHLQSERRRRGNDWEKDLVKELDSVGWAKRWPKDFSGQPFDIQACLNGASYGIECKRLAKGNLGYSAFTQNEIEHLSRHEDAGGISVVAVFRDEPFTRVFVPWFAIRNEVLGGERGSVKLTEYPEQINNVLEVPRP